MVCLVGTLAVYSHHRHVELPMPTDSLSSLVQWASQPILQVQQKDETLGVLQSHSCQLVNPFLKAVGVQLTPGFVTRRLRQGGHRQHRREALRQVSSSGRWGHSAHDKSCLKQMCTPMKDMAAGAGHIDRSVLLGSSAISARRTEELEDLY